MDMSLSGLRFERYFSHHRDYHRGGLSFRNFWKKVGEGAQIFSTTREELGK